ncbi:hypothetical protein T05_8351 [Trichinella murrelli]|uniref:Uncharacterized protein n=1 Tax=Trichinella murrelli TaxID=144512 RepID=A0A0V0TCV4_9BILA|nr:hypothetical protein T05_8351 [Trichinella murrelli]
MQGVEPLDQLPCRLFRAIHAQQSLLELLEGVLPCLSRRVELAADWIAQQVASDRAVVRGRNPAYAEKVFQRFAPTGAQLYSHSGPLFIYWSLSSLFY